MKKHAPADEMRKDLDILLSRINALEVSAPDDYQKDIVKIKAKNEDFVVSEVLSKKSLSQFEDSGYAIYKLKKRNIDTHHALSKILKKHGIKLKALGLKDASAITEQYVCTINKSSPPVNITEDNFSLSRIGFVKKPLRKSDMIGNGFKIKITDNMSDFSEFNESDKILNFFGYQRFGSTRPVTHLIGKALVQKNFELALTLLLSYTSEFDSTEHNEIRKKLEDIDNFKKLIDDMPYQMDLEKLAISEMIKSGDSFQAMRALPLNIRRFYVQAYQSFIFNKTLSAAYNASEELFVPSDDDVCFDKNNIIGKYEKDPKQRLAVPIVGHSYFKKTRFDYYISEILSEEEVSAKDFFIKEMQEISNEGGFRNSCIKCDDFSINNDTVSFTLSRGSYATMILREIMKPANPLDAGF